MRQGLSDLLSLFLLSSPLPQRLQVLWKESPAPGENRNHNGFGLHTFQEELTGPEYAARFIRQAEDLHIEYKLNTLTLRYHLTAADDRPVSRLLFDQLIPSVHA